MNWNTNYYLLQKGWYINNRTFIAGSDSLQTNITSGFIDNRGGSGFKYGFYPVGGNHPGVTGQPVQLYSLTAQNETHPHNIATVVYEMLYLPSIPSGW